MVFLCLPKLEVGLCACWHLRYSHCNLDFHLVAELIMSSMAASILTLALTLAMLLLVEWWTASTTASTSIRLNRSTMFQSMVIQINGTFDVSGITGRWSPPSTQVLVQQPAPLWRRPPTPLHQIFRQKPHPTELSQPPEPSQAMFHASPEPLLREATYEEYLVQLQQFKLMEDHVDEEIDRIQSATVAVPPSPMLREATPEEYLSQLRHPYVEEEQIDEINMDAIGDVRPTGDARPTSDVRPTGDVRSPGDGRPATAPPSTGDGRPAAAQPSQLNFGDGTPGDGTPATHVSARRLHAKQMTPSKVAWLSCLSIPVCITSSLMCMMPSGWGQTNGSRMPPSWSPENAERYSFRKWARDILLWSIVHQDMNESRKAAAVVSVLRGAAQELCAEAVPPLVLVQGGPVNGIQTDPITNVMHLLAENYAQLGEEVRLHLVCRLLHELTLPLPRSWWLCEQVG